MQSICAHLVDLDKKTIYPAQVDFQNGKITNIIRCESAPQLYICPGFVDAHVHVESSMLVPSEFAKEAVIHGTVATVSDPHEIANVLGAEGVLYMLENARQVPFHFAFGAPSCVPATCFETAGAELSAGAVAELLAHPQIYYLSEVMNYPGVIQRADNLMQMIAAAQKLGKPVDGHAPGVRGEALQKYISAGISTDHECFTYDEGKEKLQSGMKVLIREGSAAKNYAALIPLIKEFPEQIMFCSDDKHPNDLVRGHINKLCARAVADGYEVYAVLRSACVHPVEHYRLPVGLLRIGESADFVILKDLTSFEVVETYIQGQKVAAQGVSFIATTRALAVNQWSARTLETKEFVVPAVKNKNKIRCIEVYDGQIVTGEKIGTALIKHEEVVSDLSQDIVKIAVVNRYSKSPPAVAFVHGTGLRRGALASSVAHDSHNIVAVGVTDEDIAAAVNLVMKNSGGVASYSPESSQILPLSVAGLMSLDAAQTVALEYEKVEALAKSFGTTLTSPFMTLSFLALLVIPSLKLSDKGLFDGRSFSFTEISI